MITKTKTKSTGRKKETVFKANGTKKAKEIITKAKQLATTDEDYMTRFNFKITTLVDAFIYFGLAGYTQSMIAIRVRISSKTLRAYFKDHDRFMDCKEMYETAIQSCYEEKLLNGDLFAETGNSSIALFTARNLTTFKDTLVDHNTKEVNVNLNNTSFEVAREDFLKK